MKKQYGYSIVLGYFSYIFLGAFFLFLIPHMDFLHVLPFQDSILYCIFNADNIINFVYFIIIIIFLCHFIFRYSFNDKICFFTSHTIYTHLLNLFLLCLFMFHNYKLYSVNYNSSYILYVFFTQSLTVAIIEECFFRGFLFERFLIFKNDTVNFFQIVIFNAILFSIAHLYNLFFCEPQIVFFQLLILFVMGSILTLFYYLHHNITICISIHVTFNMISALTIQQIDTFIYLTILGIVLVIKYMRKHKKEYYIKRST